MQSYAQVTSDDVKPSGYPYALPISKLRGVPHSARVALKSRKITNCSQLLTAAGEASRRLALAQQIGADPELLVRIVQRADMARVNGVGAVFGLMLEDLGIRDVAALARQAPEHLHAQVRDYNQQERIARRSPTPEEVQEWVTQARALEKIITY